MKTFCIFRRPLLLAAAVLLLAVMVCGAWLWPYLRGGSRRFDTLKDCQPISGRWSEHDGVLSNSNYGRGDMLIAKHFAGRDYRVSVDLRFDLTFSDTDYGDAGVAIRVSNPQPGVDSYDGYYAGIRSSKQTLILGRATYEWEELAHTALAQPLKSGSWVRLEVAARGCNFALTVTPLDDKQLPTRLNYRDPHCLTEGTAGLRSFYTQASWRNFHIDSF